MRIVLVSDSFTPATDPAAETARQICDTLVAGGHEVLVVTATAGKDSYRTATVWRLRRTPNPLALQARIAEFAPEVVQVLHPRALGATVLRALEHEAVPLVVLDPTPVSPRVGTVLASSHAGARALARVGLRARVWAPGVRADEHHPGLRSAELHDAWARITSPAGPHLVVGYAGPVGAPTRNHVRRLARIAALDGVRLVVLGRGPGTGTLKAAGARIVGQCGGLELARGLASLDVLVQPRKGERHLAVVRKALASGVPVVAIDTAAATEVLTDGHNGVLVPRGLGRGAFAEAVATLAADHTRRAALAANARASVAGRTWDDAVVELLEIYRPLAHAA